MRQSSVEWNREKVVPNFKPWYAALKKMEQEVEAKHQAQQAKTAALASSRRRSRRSRYRRRSRRRSRSSRSQWKDNPANLYARLRKRVIPEEEKHENIKFPVDPVALSCAHPNLAKSCGKTRKSVYASCAGWGKDYMKRAKAYSGDAMGSSSIASTCGKLLWYVGRAHCSMPEDPAFKKQWEDTRRFCLDNFKYLWLRTKYSAQGKIAPLWAMSPKAAKRKIKESVSRGIPMWRYLRMLAYAPKHQGLKDAFDEKYARLLGVSRETAAQYREKDQLGGPMSLLKENELYKKAIDELLGRHHSYKGGQAKFGFNYQQAHYLATKVYIPALRQQDKFKLEQCAYNLRNKRRNFHGKAVTKALAGGDDVCKGRSLRVTGSRVMSYPTFRMRLILELAKKTANPRQTIREAADVVARQVAAKRTRFCWVESNPPKLRQNAGPKASCYGFAKVVRGGRIGYFNFDYTLTPIRKLTKFQVLEAREVLRIAGQTGNALDKKLKRAYRSARGYKCVAFNNSVAKEYQGGGRYGSTRHYAVGGNKEVPCSRTTKSRFFRKLYPRWNNYFDTVLGGRTFGRWRVKRQKYWPKKILRKTREAYIYVKRKI